MLAAGLLRTSVVYGFASTLVVLAFYLVGKERYFLVPLRSLRVLAVPDAATRWLDSGGPTSVWRPISNLVVPLLMVVTAGLLLRVGSGGVVRGTVASSAMVRRSLKIIAGLVGIFVVSMIVYVLGPYPGVATRLAKFHVKQYHSYALTGLHGTLGVGGGSWWLSALFLIPILTLAWAVISWRFGGCLPDALDGSDGGPAQV
jgi:hypothetical protein